jgi:hypothetical protein
VLDTNAKFNASERTLIAAFDRERIIAGLGHIAELATSLGGS